MMQENMIQALKHFLKMLDLPLSGENDNPEEFITYALSIIKKALATGAKANRSEGGYTPLMLYACFDIHDERLAVELAKGTDSVTQTKDLITDESPTPKISAITFAIAFGSLNILEKLYELNCFSKEHLEEAAFFAVSMNSLTGIKFLRAKGINLFHPMMFFSINPLHLACQAGFTDIVKEILATNPAVEELTARTIDGKDAYSFAVDAGHHECIQLFNANIIGKWKQLEKAIHTMNFARLQEITESNPDMTLWHGPHRERAITLLGMAARMNIYNDEPVCEQMYKYCEMYVNSQSYQIQINSLILALSTVQMIDENKEKAQEIFDQLFKKLLSLEPHFSSVDELIVNGLETSSSIIDIVCSVIKNRSLRKLDFSVYNGNIFDVDTQDGCTINLLRYHASQIVGAIIRNTTLTECPLYLTSSHKSIIDLLNLVLERNKLITAASQSTVREWIFNKYVSKINSLIEVIRKNPKIEHAELLEPLDGQHNVHSLRSLIAFNMANKWIAHTPKKIPVELQELIVTSKTPTIS